MSDQHVIAEELLLDIKVAEASKLYKFYLNQERKVLGGLAVIAFLTLWEFMGGALSAYNPISFLRINPMFMSAPLRIAQAAHGLFSSGEIYNDPYVSGIEFFWGYLLSILIAIPFGIGVGWYMRCKDDWRYYAGYKIEGGGQMESPSLGLTIPWKDFRRVLREEQIFHAQHCSAKKDACLAAWLDRWCYCDSYVVGRTRPSSETTLHSV